MLFKCRIFSHTGETGVDGKFIGDFVATGIIPNALEKIRENGVAVNNDWFTN